MSGAQDVSSLLVTRIIIERHMSSDGEDSFTAEFTDGAGDQPSLVETLGMLELAKDTAIRVAMGEGDCDCEDDDDE